MLPDVPLSCHINWLIFFFYIFVFRIEALQGDSDHSPFYYYLGVPSFSPAYMYNPKVSSSRSLHAMLNFGLTRDLILKNVGFEQKFLPHCKGNLDGHSIWCLKFMEQKLIYYEYIWDISHFGFITPDQLVSQ